MLQVHNVQYYFSALSTRVLTRYGQFGLVPGGTPITVSPSKTE